MHISNEELSILSDEEITSLRLANRAWSKQLRLQMTALVNTRIAGQISHEEYAASRKAAMELRAECDRRTAELGI